MTDQNCDSCGHSADEHLVCGYADERLAAPARGWIECPEPGCKCYATWAAGPELLAHLLEQQPNN